MLDIIIQWSILQLFIVYWAEVIMPIEGAHIPFLAEKIDSKTRFYHVETVNLYFENSCKFV